MSQQANVAQNTGQTVPMNEQIARLNAQQIHAMQKSMLDQFQKTGNSASIINMASVAGSVKGIPNRFAYGASKAAVVGLTKAVAADYVQKGVRCNAIAPGTVGMHPSTSYMRRSRLNPMTYSMCCQRPSRPPRLATLVLPETAPTRSSANGCTRWEIVSGANMVSPSTVTMISPDARAMPALSASAFPLFAC